MVVEHLRRIYKKDCHVLSVLAVTFFKSNNHCHNLLSIPNLFGVKYTVEEAETKAYIVAIEACSIP